MGLYAAGCVASGAPGFRSGVMVPSKKPAGNWLQAKQALNNRASSSAQRSAHHKGTGKHKVYDPAGWVQGSADRTKLRSMLQKLAGRMTYQEGLDRWYNTGVPESETLASKAGETVEDLFDPDVPMEGAASVAGGPKRSEEMEEDDAEGEKTS